MYNGKVDTETRVFNVMPISVGEILNNDVNNNNTTFYENERTKFIGINKEMFRNNKIYDEISNEGGVSSKLGGTW